MLFRDVQGIEVAEGINNRIHVFLALSANIFTTYLSVRLALISSLMIDRG